MESIYSEDFLIHNINYRNGEILEMNKIYDYPQNFFNRELSWLEFNKRVLDEAHNEENPLLERVKFLSIFNSNLDEFFMVRVASLLRKYKQGIKTVDMAGMTPKTQLDKIIKKVRFLLEEQYKCYNELTRLLSLKNIKVHKYKNLCDKSKRYIDDFITSSNNTKSTLSSSVGIFINLLKTDGTCIVPNICALLFCVFNNAAIFKVLFNNNGKGRAESITIGVKTGYISLS